MSQPLPCVVLTGVKVMFGQFPTAEIYRDGASAEKAAAALRDAGTEGVVVLVAVDAGEEEEKCER